MTKNKIPIFSSDSKGFDPLKLAGRKQMELGFGETQKVRRDCKIFKIGLQTQSRFPMRKRNASEKKLIGSPYRKTPTCRG